MRRRRDYAKIKQMRGKELTIVFDNGATKRFDTLKEYRDYIKWYQSQKNKSAYIKEDES